jgi:hypothetical protein
MFDIENLMQLGVFSQLLPIWQVFFFIAALLPFLLMDRVKICLLVTYLFTFYLGFMVQWGEYLSSTGSMQPCVLYSLSGFEKLGALCPLPPITRRQRGRSIHCAQPRPGRSCGQR